MFYGRIAVRILYILVGGLVGHAVLGSNAAVATPDIFLAVAAVLFLLTIALDVVIPTYDRWLRREEHKSKVKAAELDNFFAARKKSLNQESRPDRI